MFININNEMNPYEKLGATDDPHTLLIPGKMWWPNTLSFSVLNLSQGFPSLP